MRISVTGEPDPTYCKASADGSGTSYNLNAAPLFTKQRLSEEYGKVFFPIIAFLNITKL